MCGLFNYKVTNAQTFNTEINVVVDLTRDTYMAWWFIYCLNKMHAITSAVQCTVI